MKRFAFVFSFILLAALVANAQVVPSASGRRFSISVGAMGSGFEPDFTGEWACGGSSCPPSLYYPRAQAANQLIVGPGAFVDVKFTRWVQIEGEARWLRFHRFEDIHQDSYLVGPKVPVYRIWKGSVYGKALGGFSRMDLGFGYHGTFTTLAFGGGMDIKLTKKISIRAIDAEYQYWPTWGNSHLTPYGASAGISYKIF